MLMKVMIWCLMAVGNELQGVEEDCQWTLVVVHTS